MNSISEKVSKRLRDTFIFPKYALEIHKLISSQYQQTYFVGGVVRNLFLKKKVGDIDIATKATPKQIIPILINNRISFTAEYQKFGVIIAKVLKGRKPQKIEITTFRLDTYHSTRYPHITFTNQAKSDSLRRDFTMNAIYYSPVTKELLDFHQGIEDLKKGLIRFIGNPIKRIEQDPLRIIRAYRFKLQYNLQFENKTLYALKKNMYLLKKLSKTRLQREINMLTSQQLKNKLQKVIHNNT